MGLMFPVREHRAASIAAVTMRRPFLVSFECAECQKPGAIEVPMVDETDGAATIQDFVDSGALNKIRAECDRCGCGHIEVTNIAYVRQPTDGPRE